METVLVVGVDGVVGANIASTLSATRSISGVGLTTAPRLPEVLTDGCGPESPEDLRAHIHRAAPRRIVYCGSGSRSAWTNLAPVPSELALVTAMMEAARAVSAGVTLISSDAVFTGPWMFHGEASHNWCQSPEAQSLRAVEEVVLQHQPEALVIRSHAFGWGPVGTDAEWLESLVESLQTRGPFALDAVCHASPILASDLAQVISTAWSAGLAGVYHVGGAERTNPVRFADSLARQFGFPSRTSSSQGSLTAPAQGFGRGETSLQTRKIRRALGIGMPLLSEGLERLHQQWLSGYRDRLRGERALNRVA